MKIKRRIVLIVAGMALAASVWSLSAAGYIHAKAWLAQHLIEKAWTRTLAGETRVRPWAWADTWPVARLKAPRLGYDMIVLAGGSGRTLAFGPGNLDGSAAPGEPGHSVISGHRDTHFRFLKHLALGDRLTIQTTSGTEQAFRVSQTRIVNSATTRLSTGGMAPVLTLATCYPFDAIIPGGPLRYLVTAEAFTDEL